MSMNRPEIIEAIDTIGIQLKEMLYNLPDDTQLAVLNSIGKMLRLTTELSTKQVFPCTAVFQLAKGGYLRYDIDLPCPPFGDFAWRIGSIDIPDDAMPSFQDGTFLIPMGTCHTEQEANSLIKLGWTKTKESGDAPRAK